jgi:diaminohydroxyphosphoribosylaminopyrimidine deaminase/5-amino-6-(5-phosphoribosylamino)uracil reductase
MAIAQAGVKSIGATLYCTLEPCNAQGVTGPCSQAVIAAGIAKVVIGQTDPHQAMSGGVKSLQDAGIEVEVGVQQDSAISLNASWNFAQKNNRPWVIWKTASTLDGFVAADDGSSKWITGEAARQDVQHWRARSCAILTGIETVLADDPQMNVRNLPHARQPLRVVVDSQLRLSPSAKILEGGNTLVAYESDAENKAEALTKAGAALIQLRPIDGKVCLQQLLGHLAEHGINEVMVEAGQTLNGALLALNLIDEFVFYYAPTLLGSDARSMFSIPVLNNMDEKVQLSVLDVRQFGQDIRIRAKPTSKP